MSIKMLAADKTPVIKKEFEAGRSVLAKYIDGTPNKRIVCKVNVPGVMLHLPNGAVHVIEGTTIRPGEEGEPRRRTRPDVKTFLVTSAMILSEDFPATLGKEMCDYLAIESRNSHKKRGESLEEHYTVFLNDGITRVRPVEIMTEEQYTAEEVKFRTAVAGPLIPGLKHASSLPIATAAQA